MTDQTATTVQVGDEEEAEPEAVSEETGQELPAEGGQPATTPGEDVCHLRLYIAGQSPKSLKALSNLQRLCAERLEGRYEIEVVDLVKNPRLAAGDEIIAIPTLVRRLPEPMRKIIGDLSDAERVIVGLQLLPPGS
ncbi:MAG TPA: circadian clock KaiB family protein [Propionibacteriaceae bacterium]